MSRFASSLNETACANNQPLCHFADFDWPTGRLRITDWPGTVTWGGNSWLGVGTFGGLGAIQESLDYVAASVQALLYIGDNVDDAVVASAMNDRFQGKAAAFYIGWFADNGQLVDTPETLWAGRLDTMTMDFVQNVLSVTCEYRLRKEPPTARMTDEDQRSRFTGDVYFELISTIPQYVSHWGEAQQTYYGGLPGGRVRPPAGPPPPRFPGG